MFQSSKLVDAQNLAQLRGFAASELYLVDNFVTAGDLNKDSNHFC